MGWLIAEGSTVAEFTREIQFYLLDGWREKKEHDLHVWVHQLLRDVVEEVPASVGKGAL